MIEELRKNVDTEIEILREIAYYMKRIEVANGAEKKQIEMTINALTNSIKLINNALPELINNVPHDKKLTVKSEDTGLEKVSFKRTESDIIVNLHSEDKERFLRELSISESLIKKIKKKQYIESEKYEEFKAARGYLKLSNKYFLPIASDYVKAGYFRNLNSDLKKANIEILFETYIAMVLFTTFLSIWIGIALTVFLLFFKVGLLWPFVSIYSGSYLSRLIYIIWVPLVVPIVTFLALYFYPSTERSSIEKRIDNELPFAVIHMSAISGSGIAPTEIFKIIGMNSEYPSLRREIRKVLNQINIYGYDLVTALGNVSKSTPSSKLAELFNGMSTTINSGGDLSEFFEKRAETLLASYRMEREKFTHIAETFMDIYISVVIATPMILMLLLVMISLTGIQTGFSNTVMSLIIILIIAIINIAFLGFLQIKQPSY